MGHGHHNPQNEFPSGFPNWFITAGFSILLGIGFVIAGAAWKGPGAGCCGGHGTEACCSHDEGHGDGGMHKHECGEECHKNGKCMHEGAEHKHGSESHEHEGGDKEHKHEGEKKEAAGHGGH